jgi:hypothetical protein
MQRTYRDEFYTRPLPWRVCELQRELDAYLEHYNRCRPKLQGESVPQTVSNVVANYRPLTPLKGFGILLVAPIFG